MASRSISVESVQKEDLPTCVHIELEAFRSHPRTPALWRNGYTADLYAFMESSKLKAYDDPESRFMKAVDETGRVIAVSQWTFALDPDVTANKPLTKADEQPPSDWPEKGNWEIRRHFTIEWERFRKETFAGRSYIALSILVTDPQYSGRGAGSKLVAWGCEQADKLDLPICLESTPAGFNLYKRFGFEQVRVINCDMKLLGWHETYDEEAAKRFWMIRESKSQRSAASTRA